MEAQTLTLSSRANPHLLPQWAACSAQAMHRRLEADVTLPVHCSCKRRPNLRTAPAASKWNTQSIRVVFRPWLPFYARGLYVHHGPVHSRTPSGLEHYPLDIRKVSRSTWDPSTAHRLPNQLVGIMRDVQQPSTAQTGTHNSSSRVTLRARM
jgi:hypothetical protein